MSRRKTPASDRRGFVLAGGGRADDGTGQAAGQIAWRVKDFEERGAKPYT
jgi:hypothetical protein